MIDTSQTKTTTIQNIQIIEEECKRESKPWDLPEGLDLDKLDPETAQLWKMRQANIRNGGRPRFPDFTRPYNVDDCYEKEGGYWISWVVERMTPE